MPIDPETHLDPRTLERALTGAANRFDVRAAVRHLTARCPDCAARAAEVAERRGPRPAGEAATGPYDEALAKVLTNVSATELRMVEERLHGTLQWTGLRGLPQTARRARVARDEAYHTLGFVAAAAERAEQLGQVAPRAAVAAAELAVSAASRLAAAGKPSPALAADAEATALGALGEARRRAGSLDSAQEALRTAQGVAILTELARSLAEGRAGGDICATTAAYLQCAWHRPLPSPELDALDDALASAAH